MFSCREILSRPHYWLAEMRFALARAVGAYQDQHQLSQAQLAVHLGCIPRYVATLLNGEANPSLEKMCRISLAVGRVPMTLFEELEAVLIRETAASEQG